MSQYARLQIKTATETESWDNVGFGTSDYKVPIINYANTVKDGSGDDLVPLVDSAGHLQVDTLSMNPGTGATSLGKAEDAAHTSGDVGVMALGVRETDDFSAQLTGADGDYTVLSTDYGGWLRTKGQALFLVDACTATTDFTVLGNDTINLTTATEHLAGSASLSFDKTNGAANTKIAGIQKTLGTTIDFFKVAGVIGYIQSMVYLSSVTDCDYFFVRLGTSSSHYNEWRIDIGDAWTAGVWNTVQISLADTNFAGSTGNGWNPMAVDYLAFGVAFDAETDALAGILVDRIVFVGGTVTSSDITASITSDISSANVNLLKVGNKTVNTGAGNVGTGTQRVTIATDDANLATLSGAVAAGQVQVDIVASLPAGSSTIGYVNIVDSGGKVIKVIDDGADNIDNTFNQLTTAALGYVFDGTAWDRARGTSADGALVNLGANNDVDTELPAAAALADNAANPTTPIVGSALMVFDGSTWDRAKSSQGDGGAAAGYLQNLPMMYNGSTHDRLRGDLTNGLLVNLGGNNDVTMATLPDTGTDDILGCRTALEATLTVDLGANNDVTTELPAAAALADATANPTITSVGNFNQVLSPTAGTWNRQKSVANTTNTSGIGVASAGLMAQFDDASPQTVTENNFGNVRMSTNGVIYSTLRDAAGNERGVNINASNELQVDDDAGNTLLGTIDSDTDAIKTAVEKIDGAVVGPGEPTIDSYTQLAINLNAGADQVLVSSSASKQIWVYGVTYTCSVAGTVSFQDESDTAITGIMDHAANSGLNTPPSGNFAMPLWKLGTDKDLEVDVVTAAIDGFITYAIVSV